MPTTVTSCGAGAGQHRGAVADREVGRVGGRPVDDDLVGGPRRAAGDQLERVEPLVVGPGAPAGAAPLLIVDRLAVACPTTWAKPSTPRRDGGHAVDAGELGGQAGAAPARAGSPLRRS